MGAGAGRPSVLLQLGRGAGVAVGIEIGKQHVHAVLSDLAHEVIAERRVDTAVDLPARECADLLADLVAQLLEETGDTRSAVLGVGAGLPGPIGRPGLRVGDASILPGWVGVEAESLLSRALDLPTNIENDANLGALGEWMWGAGRGCRDLLFIKVATGVGAGLIVGGQLATGAGGTAGEVGHTVVEPDGQICRCGNRGCLETVAGSAAVLDALRNVRPRATLEDVVAAAAAGDPGCRRVVADAGMVIGDVLGAVCNLLNPERVVVGGELSAAGTALTAPLESALRRACLPNAGDDLTVVTGKLGDRAVALGGVGRVLNDVSLVVDRGLVETASVH